MYDRIHLRTTYYNYAKHLEAKGEYTEAIPKYVTQSSTTTARYSIIKIRGGQWLSRRVLGLRPKGPGFEPHQCHCVVSLSKNINPSIVLVQPRKTRSIKRKDL